MRTAAALSTVAVTAVTLAVLAVVLLTGGPGDSPASTASTASPAPTASPVSAPTPTSTTSAGPSPVPAEVGRAPATPAPGTPTVPPTRVVVDGAEIDADVVPVGVAADGQMELPDDPDVLGWYRYGPAPGDGGGSIVLGGHLDSRRYGVGQLARLRTTQVGDVVTVGGATGKQNRYRVVDVEQVRQAELDVSRLFRRDGEETLVLITCGGSYDPELGYEENLVVSAVPA